MPNDFSACCEAFEAQTNSCYYDIRYEWDSEGNEWCIAIPESAGGGGILISYCPHCGACLNSSAAPDMSPQLNSLRESA